MLKSFSFGHLLGVNELPNEVLGLFVGLADNPTKQVEYSSEIISSGLSGKINFKHEFNLDAYETAIRKNLRLGNSRKRKKEVYLDCTDSNDDWENTALSGGIKADTATMRTVDKLKDAYEELLADDELKYAVDTIKDLQPILLAETKLDIVRLIGQALKGIPESIKALTDLCSNYEVVGEQIKIILSSGYSFEDVFA